MFCAYNKANMPSRWSARELYSSSMARGEMIKTVLALESCTQTLARLKRYIKNKTQKLSYKAQIQSIICTGERELSSLPIPNGSSGRGCGDALARAAVLSFAADRRLRSTLVRDSVHSLSLLSSSLSHISSLHS